jgi:hypothetical protein
METAAEVIRFLVESYYDMQKLRVETFNRIVAYVKSQTKLETQKTYASQPANETQCRDASHRTFETQNGNASQTMNETHSKIASHNSLETHSVNASQSLSETHRNNASQHKCETQEKNASHDYVETQKADASHQNFETQKVNASQHAFETHRVNASQDECETQYLNASHSTIETHPVNASYNSFETQKTYASQGRLETQVKHASFKPSEIAKAYVLGKVKPPGEIAELVWFHNMLWEAEKQLAHRLNAWSSHHPLRINFLNRIQGIGGILSSGLIAWLSPISNYANISKLWAHCGLAPGQKRRKGEKAHFNVRLKTLCWKIAVSFEMQKPEKSFYRRIYDAKKRYYLSREDLKQSIEAGEKGIIGHIRNMTLRYTVKRFLADLWIAWRQLEGLPITLPYAHAVKGHVDYEPWEPDKHA